MSRLYSLYLNLKKENPNTIFLFKSGIFFIALDKDAYYLSNLFSFKLTDLNTEVKKAGFPCSSVEKYMNLFQSHQIDYKIVNTDKNTLYSAFEFKQDKCTSEILHSIRNLNIDNLSVSEAYDFLYKLQKKVYSL